LTQSAKVRAGRAYASQHFNVDRQLLRGDRWAGSEFWDKQTDPTLTLEALIERSEIIVLGLDGGV
jgi:phage terminase large subunit-like protein